MTMILQAAVVLACLLLMVLAIEVIGSLNPGENVLGFLLWAAVALSSVAVALLWRDMPPPAAVLLLVLSAILWTHRRRIAYAAEHGVRW